VVGGSAPSSSLRTIEALQCSNYLFGFVMLSHLAASFFIYSELGCTSINECYAVYRIELYL
jgi:hypothetical protein